MPGVDTRHSHPPIRVGLLGYGMAGEYFHAPLIEAADELRLSAIATGRGDAARHRRDAPRCVPDALAVCTAADVDLVVIATPNETHFRLAWAALTAGKHVVIDKPFALTGADARELVGLAAEHRRVLGVFHNRRLDGDFLAVSQVIRERRLGEVCLIESRWDRFKKTPGNGWRNGSAPGAGLLWDLGPHLVDQAVQLLGLPDRWHADIGVQRSQGADDYFELTLWYGSMRCILSASTSVAAARPRFAVHGTLGSFVTLGVDPYEAALRRGDHPGAADFRRRLPCSQAYEVDVEGNRRMQELEAGRWEEFYPDVAMAIRAGRAPLCTAEHAVAVIDLIEAAHARR